MKLSKQVDANSVAELIDEYETNRAQNLYRERISMRLISLRLPGPNLFFIDAMADYYGQARNTLISDILETSIYQIFSSLPKEVRRVIAEKADRTWLQESNRKVFDPDLGEVEQFAIGGHWVPMADCLDKQEVSQ